jgi:hypothetical protein
VAAGAVQVSPQAVAEVVEQRDERVEGRHPGPVVAQLDAEQVAEAQVVGVRAGALVAVHATGGEHAGAQHGQERRRRARPCTVAPAVSLGDRGGDPTVAADAVGGVQVGDEPAGRVWAG